MKKKKGKVSISDGKKACVYLLIPSPSPLQNSTQRSQNSSSMVHFEISESEAIPLSVLSLKLSRPPGYSRLPVTTPLSSPLWTDGQTDRENSPSSGHNRGSSTSIFTVISVLCLRPIDRAEILYSTNIFISTNERNKRVELFIR